LSTNGDTYLGGDDFDRLIVQYWLKEAGMPESDLAENKELSQALRLKAEEAKKHLSSNENFEAKVNELSLVLSRQKFEDLVAPLIERTIQSCRNAVADA